MSLNQKTTSERKNGEEPFVLKNEIYSLIKMFVFIFIIVSLLNMFVVRTSTVKGISMQPTLGENDRLITTTLVKEYARGDIVTIKRYDNDALVKRVIAVEGDIIDIDFETGEVFVNGDVINEPYIAEKTRERLTFDEPVAVPENHVFVMGDNRNNSDDSRNAMIGMIDVNNIFGKVIIRIFPFTTFD